jgi:hypothetical protein
LEQRVQKVEGRVKGTGRGVYVLREWLEKILIVNKWELTRLGWVRLHEQMASAA